MVFCGHNKTKVVNHLARKSGKGIAPCKGEIDSEILSAYQGVLTRHEDGVVRRERARAHIFGAMEEHQTEVATEISTAASRSSASREAGQLSIH